MLLRERKGKERKGKERKGKERKGKERKGTERKGKDYTSNCCTRVLTRLNLIQANVHSLQPAIHQPQYLLTPGQPGIILGFSLN